MSKSKQPQSGLRTVQRDFSSQNDVIDVDAFEWEPTPPVPTVTTTTKRALTGSQQRIKDIEDALAGNSQSQSQSRPPAPLSSQFFVNKRPNSDFHNDVAPPPAKRRLPSSWEDNEKDVGPSKHAIASRHQSTTKAKSTSTTTATATTNPAKLFLSQEQTQILKLVTEGHSIFYTGSAGQSFCASCIISTCIWPLYFLFHVLSPFLPSCIFTTPQTQTEPQPSLTFFPFFFLA